MSCDDYVLWISMAQDGELAEPERGQLEAHLGACEACRELAGDFKVQRLLLAAMAPVKAPEHGWQRLSRSIEAIGPLGSPEPFQRVEGSTPPSTARFVGRAVASARSGASPWGRRLQQGVRAATGLVAGFCGLLLWLGYTDVDVVQEAPPAVVVEASTLLSKHALAQSVNPMDDRGAWHLLASSAGWARSVESSDEEPPARRREAGTADPDADLL